MKDVLSFACVVIGVIRRSTNRQRSIDEIVEALYIDSTYLGLSARQRCTI